jgi:hypothetical protein
MQDLVEPSCTRGDAIRSALERRPRVSLSTFLYGIYTFLR